MDMLKILRKYVVYTVAALLLASCSAEVGEPAVISSGDGSGQAAAGTAIRFDTGWGDGLSFGGTRAVGTVGDSELKSQGFGVFACHHGTHPYSSSNVSANFMWNQEVNYRIIAGGGHWVYEPVMYWPQGSGDEDNREYISFFAYGPYSPAGGSECITDFSKNTENGDPWLVYQLGGTTTDWQSKQVDLLYAFTKDQQQPSKGSVVSKLVTMDFKHALATVGDKVKFEAASDLQNRLKEEATALGGELKLYVTGADLDYTLLRKGKLILNSDVEPNWQFVNSEDPLVHRQISPAVSPQRLATATSSAVSVESDVMTSTDNGIFYIPLEVAGYPQTVSLTAHYEVRKGSAVLYTGASSRTVPLTVAGMDGRYQDLKVSLTDEIPGVLLSSGGVALSSALEMSVGDSPVTVTASVHPAGLTLNWANSDNAVATIAAAVTNSIPVTPVAAGTTTVTATAADGSVTATLDITVSEPTPGFTINSSGDKVAFASGNLQATTSDLGAHWTWKFADHQWDYVGDAEIYPNINDDGTVSVNGTVDLFRWVGESGTLTGAAQYGITHSNVDADYSTVQGEAMKAEWNSTNLSITNGGGYTWRTPTSAELGYVLNVRESGATVNGASNARFAFATINTDGTGVNGIILFPDGCTIEAGAVTTWGTINGTSSWGTKCTTAQWAYLESEGCVFLPAAGFVDTNFFGGNVMYQTSSYGTSTAQNLILSANTYVGLSVKSERNKVGFSVRLVRDVP